MYEHYLGVDLHKRRNYLVLMDAHGQVKDQRRLANEAVAAYAAQLPSSAFAVLEATGNWSYMYAVLRHDVDQVVLAHPKRVRAIAAAKVKTDKIDATILAHLARADLLPTAYAPAIEIRELRETVCHRAKLVRERTRHKNQIDRPLSLHNLQPLAKTYLVSGDGNFCAKSESNCRSFIGEFHLKAGHHVVLSDGAAGSSSTNGTVSKATTILTPYATPSPAASPIRPMIIVLMARMRKA